MALYRLFYGRVSSKDQNLDLQLAQAREMDFDQVFAERITGRRADRPQFLAMVEAALDLRQQGHQVECWVVEWTRWARNTVYALDKVRQLEAAGVVIMELTTRQPVSLSTASGLITTGTKSLMAEYYSAELSERLQRSIAQRRRLNKPVCAAPAFGYQRTPDKSRLEPSPEWRIARELAERFIAGQTISYLIGWLWQEHGISRSRQGLWAWLKSPVIRGHLSYQNGKDIRYGQHPALITEAEARQIEYRLNLNRQLRGANTTATVYAVPGLVWCGECGRRAGSHRSGDRRKRYFECEHAVRRGDCSNRLTVDDRAIEAAIQEALLETAVRLAEALASADTTDPAIAALQAERATLEPLAHRPAIAEELAAIDAEIANRRAGHQRQDSGRLRELVIQLGSLTSADWDQLAPSQRRQLYQDVVDRVTILGREVIEVRLKV